LQPRNKRAFEYTAITIVPVLFSTIEAEYFFYIKYEDDVGSNGDNGNNTVTMVIASSKSNIFFLCCIFVNVIWQILTMVLISKQREKLVLNLYKECKAIREIAKEAKMSFRYLGYILSEAGKQEKQTDAIDLFTILQAFFRRKDSIASSNCFESRRP
jgi:hypothetical protein